MFLGLEILSLAVYVMAAMHLRRSTSQEAGIKYLVLGAFSSAFFLYGIALVYGGTGSTNLVRIAELFATSVLSNNGLVLAGLALLLVCFGFKVAIDRKSVVWGKSVSVRVDLDGRRYIKKKILKHAHL